MNAMAAFVLSFATVGLWSASGDAQDIPKPLTLSLSVGNVASDVPVHVHITDESGFDVVSGDGTKETLEIPDPSPQKHVKLSYVLELQLGSRSEQFYLSVRDVHFGRLLNLSIDLKAIDPGVKDDLVRARCKNVPSGISNWLNEIVMCRQIYNSFDGGTYIDRFAALRGWFDASQALAIIPSSAFRLDPDVLSTVRKFESGAADEGAGAVAVYRTYFPTGYVDRVVADASTSRLADFREIGNLLKTGNIAAAAKVNDFSTELFESLSSAPNSTKYIGGLSHELLDQNKTYLQNLQAARPPGPQT